MPLKMGTQRSLGVRFFLALAVVLLLSACAPPANQRQRFFWPIGSAEPKVEYINYYQSRKDVRRGVEGWLTKAVLGEEKAVRYLSRPFAIASDGKGRVFVSDLDRHEVAVFDLETHEIRTLGKGYRFRHPSGIAVAPSGEVYVTDSLEAEVHIFGPDEGFVKKFQSTELVRPTGLVVDPVERRLYVADPGAHRVAVFDQDGEFLHALGERGAEEGRFNFPLDVDLDTEGNLYVLDAMNARVQVFGPDGRFLRAFGERGTAAGSFRVAKSLSVSPSGFVFISDTRANRLFIFDLEGNFMMSLGGLSPIGKGGVRPGGLYLPQGVDVDDKDAIWVVDSLNRMFHQFQFLNPEYLSEHPILPGQAFLPNVSSPKLEERSLGGER